MDLADDPFQYYSDYIKITGTLGSGPVIQE